MKCRTSSSITYSSTGRALFFDVFCRDQVLQYIAYVRRGRTFVQEFYRTPRPRFGRVVREFYVCAECNSLYINEEREMSRNIDIYVVQCIPLTESDWSGITSIQDFYTLLNNTFNDALERLTRAVDDYFGEGNSVPLLGKDLDNCCEGNGPALFFSCEDLSVTSYRRPLSYSEGTLCLSPFYILTPEGSEVEGSTECFPYTI